MSDQPFPETLRDLLEERDLTLRDLTAMCQVRFGGWGSIATLSSYNTGKLVPTRKAMRRIAESMNLDPRVFAEYRLAVARDELDPEVVGLPAALNNLAVYRGLNSVA